MRRQREHLHRALPHDLAVEAFIYFDLDETAGTPCMCSTASRSSSTETSSSMGGMPVGAMLATEDHARLGTVGGLLVATVLAGEQTGIDALLPAPSGGTCWNALGLACVSRHQTLVLALFRLPLASSQEDEQG